MSEVSIPNSKHPKGLYTLFFSEMWERFCYYGMRTLLTLYLVKSLMNGDAEASLLYGAYTGLVYAAPILGGKMADKFLGYRWAVILGGILMAIGEFIILGGTEEMLMIGMGALIIGNGYFKANISTIVGKLYEDGDLRRDSGFTIFYIGINVGAFLATSVVAYVGEVIGFKYGFALAGVGMLLGILIFYFGRDNYSKADGLEVTEAGKKKVAGPLNMATIVSIGSLGLIPLCYLLILNNSILDYVFLGLFVIVAYSLIAAGVKEGVIWRDRMIALVIFIMINIVFWAFFEQAGTSLTLFADRCVNRDIFGWTMPASMTQVFNPLFIMIFGSVFSIMWIKLTKIGKNPSIPIKFALGIFQLGLGFFVAYIGFKMETDFKVPLLTLVFLYMLHTTGELFLSPIGLSMVTKLAPKKMAGTAMGAWFLSFAIANFLGGKIAAYSSGGSHAAESPIEEVEGLNDDSNLKDALAMIPNSTTKFEDWVDLSSGLDKNVDFEYLPKNITLGDWIDVRDWVTVREGLNNDVNFSDWKNDRKSLSTFSEADQWLDKAMWKDLADRIVIIVERDEKLVEDKEIKAADVLGIKAWKYYNAGIEDNITEKTSLKDGISQNQLIVRESGLNKYIDMFSIIGFVLLGFALLIVFINKPLVKLMHGVE